MRIETLVCPVLQVTIADEGEDKWSGGEAVPFTEVDAKYQWPHERL